MYDLFLAYTFKIWYHWVTGNHEIKLNFPESWNSLDVPTAVFPQIPGSTDPWFHIPWFQFQDKIQIVFDNEADSFLAQFGRGRKKHMLFVVLNFDQRTETSTRKLCSKIKFCWSSYSDTPKGEFICFDRTLLNVFSSICVKLDATLSSWLNVLFMANQICDVFVLLFFRIFWEHSIRSPW